VNYCCVLHPLCISAHLSLLFTVCLFPCLYLMASQKVSTSVTLAHFSNSTVCLSHSLGSWILDSGASDHLVGNPSLIYNLSPPKIPHNITLANGSKAQVTGIGQASPLPSLPLDYVLFVPGCPFNLISISKLISSLDCAITFTSGSFFIKGQSTGNKIGADSGSFFIKGQSTGNKIGADSKQQGLYYLEPPSPTVCNVFASPDIIHHCVGSTTLTFKVS